MQSHRSRVKSLFDGQFIDRFPMWYGAHPETTGNLMKYLGAVDEEDMLRKLDVDFRTVRPKYIGTVGNKYPDGSVDSSIWGVERDGAFCGQAITHPLENAETVADVEKHPWPRVEDWEAKSIRPTAEEYSKQYAVMGGTWSPFFHDVAEMFGMETMFIKLVEKPAVVETAIHKCVQFYLGISERMFQEMQDSLDVFFIGNDFGSQRGLICSPHMWRRYFGPGIKAMVDLGHKYGLKTALHSCGSIRSIIPDLIDMGLDIINPIQVNSADMNPEELQQEFGDDIIFFGGVDVHHILSKCSVAEVKAETKRIMDIFSKGKGYILAASHDYLLPEVPPENIAAMFQTGIEYFE